MMRFDSLHLLVNECICKQNVESLNGGKNGSISGVCKEQRGSRNVRVCTESKFVMIVVQKERD